jgi:hypothetical protein
MPLSTEDRATLLASMGQLGPHQDASEILGFLRERASDALDELELQPGHDAVRAIVARALSSLVSEGERIERCAQGRRALQAYREDLSDGDPSVMLVRQPAWVALASLEIDDAEGTASDEAYARATNLARIGFLAADLPDEPSPGQIAWAIADQASEAGWSDRAGELWAWALSQPFTDPEHPPQVRLLLAFHRIESQESGGEDLLDQVIGDPHAQARVSNHARWVRAALHREAGAADQARALLEEALAISEEEEDASVSDSIRSALKDLAPPS